MDTYKFVEKLKNSSEGIYQMGRIGYHVLDNLFSGTKRWNREVSFSQCGEDLIVSFLLKNLLNIGKVSFLDIGCNHPYRINNTVILRKKFGIRKGVLIEPNPKVCQLIKKKRKKDICLNIGVGVRGGVLPYYMMDNDTLNTFSKEEAECAVQKGFQIEKCINVKVYDINSILQKYFANGGLDFLSIDIEGNDVEVLKAIQYDKIRPSVICTETLEFMGGKDERLFGLIDFFKQNNYALVADTWINSIFIDKEKIKNKDFLTRYLF